MITNLDGSKVFIKDPVTKHSEEPCPKCGNDSCVILSSGATRCLYKGCHYYKVKKIFNIKDRLNKKEQLEIDLISCRGVVLDTFEELKVYTDISLVQNLVLNLESFLELLDERF